MRARDKAKLLKILAHPKAKAELKKRVAAKLGVKKIGDGELLKFLLEHADEIIAIIKEILAMFSL